MKTLLRACSIAAVLPLAAAAQGATAQPAAPAVAPQQVTNTMQAAILQQYKGAKDFLTRTAELMPADEYAFQPTPQMRTFAGTLGHIISSNIGQCGSLLGKKHALSGQDLAKTLTSKDEAVRDIKDAFAFCDEYFLKITDSTAVADEYVTMNGRRNGAPVEFKVSKGAGIVHFLDHNNEELGYLAVYLRLKGLVPPQSTPTPPAAGRGRSGGR